MEPVEHVQHLAAVIGAGVAAFASIFQGRRAKNKSRESETHKGALSEKHKDALSEKPKDESSEKHKEWLSRQEGDWTTLIAILEHDIEHFRKVGSLWYVFVVGAIIAALAEGFDWLGSAHKWWQ
jgi:hypothetical protein